MNDLLVLARWQFRIDPAVRRIFVVRPDVAEHPTQAAFTIKRLVVVRGDVEAPRLVERREFPMSHEMWEIPEVSLQAVDAGTSSPPEGFDRDRWHEVERPTGSAIPARISDLHVQNFRCFEDKRFSFELPFHVFIGKNGAGKTAVLDAIAHLLQQVVRMLVRDGDPGPEFRSAKRNVRLVASEQGEIPTAEPRYPSVIEADLCIYGDAPNECGFLVTSEGVGTGKPISFVNILDFVRAALATGHRQVPLPVFAYYHSRRRWPERAGTSVPRRDDTSRQSGYESWDDPAADIRGIEQWMANLELLQFQRGTKIDAVEAVKRAMLASLGGEDFEGVRFDAALGELAAKRRGGPWLPFRSLSDGVRNVLGLFADLAIRCARLNPHLGKQAPTETSGIVLIDEIDLHLHPTWQRRIVDNLREAFPRIQFIATTHSPFIVQSLRPGELIDLGERWGEYYRRSIEDIAEIMGVEHPERSQRWLSMKEAAREYYRLLQQKNGDPAELSRRKAKLDELIAPFSDDPAYAAFLEMQREAAGLGKGQP